jgi:glycosyltransferase, group 2 family protein
MMKISIIVPMYQVEQYLAICLKSITDQTMTDGVECILVDDCGSDRSLFIAKDFIEHYQGNVLFRIVEREKNGGLSAARNSGIDVASGEYVYFLDSDDEITPNCLEIMWSLVEKYGKVNLVQGAFFEDEKYANSISNIKFPEFCTCQAEIKTFLLQYLGDIVGAQSRLINLSFLKEHHLYFEEGIIHEDNLWTFFLSKYVRTMAYCDVCTYYHRYNPNSITGNVNVIKETIAYKHIIQTCSRSIDPFLIGIQKEWLLNNLITVINSKYYVKDADLKEMLSNFKSTCSFTEKLLLSLYLMLSNSALKNKMLHLLIRKFKYRD